MPYAPILDPAAYSSDTEPDRRLALEAAGVLQELAGNVPVFKMALELSEPHGAPYAPSHSADRLHTFLLRQGLVDEDVPASGALVGQLLEQLRQVKAFGELDGESLNEYIEPVSRLIRSGRVELFASVASKHSR